MRTLWQDLKYGLRMLLAKPGFTLLSITTLALGIGANTAIFSVVNGVLLRSLPYPDSDRLVEVIPSQDSFDPPGFLFWKENNKSFEAMTGYGITTGMNLSSGSEPMFVNGIRVSADYFAVFGTSPAIGRGFTKEEDSLGGGNVVVLTDELWRRHFAASSDLIGKTVTLDSESYTVVGILPQSFQMLNEAGSQMPNSADVLMPLQANPENVGDNNYAVIGKLKKGITKEQASVEMNLIASMYRTAFPDRMNEQNKIIVQNYQEGFIADIRPALLILLGAVGFVMLIACANVASLQLVRAVTRQREIAVRVALGASWFRIIRQLLTEGILLAISGGLVGLLLAIWGTDVLMKLVPVGLIPLNQEIEFDWRVLTFTFGVSVLCGVIFALAPALRAMQINVNDSLKESSAKGIMGIKGGWFRNALVVTEIALSLVLLIGATLLIRTFINITRVEPGFDVKNVLTFQVKPNGSKYATAQQTTEFNDRVLEKLRALPGVEVAAVTSNLPLSQPFRMPVWIAGQSEPVGSVQVRVVSPDYFNAMKITLKGGREFSESDKTGSEQVAIINEAFARQYLKDTNPLDQHLTYIRPTEKNTTVPIPQIVGIVGDAKQFSLKGNAPPTIFIPVSQATDQMVSVLRRFLPTTFVVRTTNNPLSLSSAVKKVMLDEDSQLAVTQVRTMEQVYSRSIETDRFFMLLLGIFAAIGLILTCVGIYGAMSNLVIQRTNEIGIRIALGAQTGNVLRMILKQGMRLVITGGTLGIIAAMILTQLLKSLLFGVNAIDAFTFVTVGLLLTFIALLACYIPARRATKVDPIIALRYE